MSLVISRQSWHYRLHSFVRKLWGWKPSPLERWSLCPYFWTIVLGTFISLLIIFPAILGWAIVRLARKAYKTGSKGGLFSRWTKLCDVTIVGRILDRSAGAFTDAFIPAGLSHLVLFAAALLIIATAGTLVYLVYHVIMVGIGSAPSMIAAAVMRLGFIIFYAFGVLGLALVHIGLALQTAGVWLYDGVIASAVWLWAGLCSTSVSVWAKLSSSATWIGLGKWILTILSSLILGLLGLVSLSVISAYTVFNDKFWTWAEMKANGYAEARRSRLEKEEEKRDSKETYKEEIVRLTEKYKNLNRRHERIDSFFKSIGDFLDILWKIIIFIPVTLWFAFWAVFIAVLIFCRNLYAKPVYKNGIESKQLGPLGLLVTMLFAFKKRACPLIEFADSVDLKDSPHPRPPVPPAAPAQPTS